MNQAATQDLRAAKVLRSIAGVLETGPAPNPRAARMLKLLRDWRTRGASRLDRALDGKIDHPGAAIMDAAWPRIADAVMSPVLGPQLGDLAELIAARRERPQPRLLLRRGLVRLRRQGPAPAARPPRAGAVQDALLRRRACSPPAAPSLWAALDAAGTELATRTGTEPERLAGGRDRERIVFEPGLLGAQAQDALDEPADVPAGRSTSGVTADEHADAVACALARARLLFGGFAALAAGAFVLLFVLSEETDDWFSWTIQPPLTAAFLGASYWAALVLFAWTARRGDWRVGSGRARAGVRDRRAAAGRDDHPRGPLPRRPVRLVLEGGLRRGAVAIASWPSPRSSACRPSVAARAIPLPSALRALLALQGVVMLAIGVYLFLAPGSADALWPWDLTPLTARAIGAFVAGFGASALHAVLANDLPSFEGAALAYATLGALELVALARYTGDLTGADGDTWLYVGFLVSVLLAGLDGWWRARALSALRSCGLLSASSAASRSA